MYLEEGTHTGVFELVDARKVFGILEVMGRDSTLSLNDDADFPPVPDGYRTLQGVLHNGDYVTLVDCVLLSIQRSQSVGRKAYSAKVFPNTIVTGPRRVDVGANDIVRASFSLTDLASVFYDSDAFCGVIDSHPFIPLLVSDKAHIRTPTIGSDPIIGYFNGVGEIASATTCFGTVTTTRRVSETFSGPSGWGVSGKIWVSIDLRLPLNLSAAMHCVHVLIRFFELLCGRKQGVRGVEVKLVTQADNERAMNVYEVHAMREDDIAARRVRLDGRRSPGPRDVLICTADDSDSYNEVIARYLETDGEWSDARGRLRDILSRGSSYSIDRIISAANMFDILPASAGPNEIELSKEVERARDAAKKLFKSLPHSVERDSVLGALGRIARPNLKQKVLHCMRIAHLDEYFEGLPELLKEAVNCRNHYVHGSPAAIDYRNNFEVVSFFSNALEFVFGVSDLVRCGWDFRSWKAGFPQADHPFAEFMLSYRSRQAHFQSLLSAK